MLHNLFQKQWYVDSNIANIHFCSIVLVQGMYLSFYLPTQVTEADI